MKKRFTRCLALALIVALVSQFLVGCAGYNKQQAVTETREDTIQEDIISESAITEEKLQETYIVENLIFEDGIYEYQISEDFISEAYIIEVTVGTQSEEDILSMLPSEIEEYDIDWGKVIGKFAVGTTIILAVGIVNHLSKGSTYFVFGSAVGVAKDALVGGAIAATLNEVVGCLKNGKMPGKGVTKYAIEGFADGYMWGAIASVLKISAENFTRLKVFKFATGGSASIKPNGEVFNEAGKLIGQAYYDKNGLWYLLDDAANSVQVFDKVGKAITDPAIIAGLNKLPHNSLLRLGTAADAAICYTDDLGHVIRVGNDLLPNMCYQLNGYTYFTDKFGRISKVVFDDLRLRAEGQPRLVIQDSKAAIGKGYELLTDDRGHLIADLFDGDNTLANIVPQAGTVNKSNVRAIEMQWQMALDEGEKVHGSIDLSYSGESFRPDAFTYSYDAGQGLVSTIISNIL